MARHIASFGFFFFCFIFFTHSFVQQKWLNVFFITKKSDDDFGFFKCSTAVELRTLYSKFVEKWKSIDQFVHWFKISFLDVEFLVNSGLNVFHIFATSWHIVVAILTFVVGENLRHQAIYFVKITFVPERWMIWRLNKSI